MWPRGRPVHLAEDGNNGGNGYADADNDVRKHDSSSESSLKVKRATFRPFILTNLERKASINIA